MQKKFMCAVVWFCLLCVGAIAGNIDCVKFLRAGNEKICMKTVKETSPALAMEIGNNIYYASAIAGNRGGVMFEYDSDIYSLYNYDDMEYELIHWLSGTDALVDGVWRDRVSGTVTLDFVNHGCVWNDAHDGYSSADGWEQYFTMKDGAVLDFGTDWYIEIIAKVDEPLGTSCFLVDFSSLGNFDTGTGLYFSNYNSDIGFMSANIKVEGAGIDMGTDDALYSWGKNRCLLQG